MLAPSLVNCIHTVGVSFSTHLTRIVNVTKFWGVSRCEVRLTSNTARLACDLLVAPSPSFNSRNPLLLHVCSQLDPRYSSVGVNPHITGVHPSLQDPSPHHRTVHERTSTCPQPQPLTASKPEEIASVEQVGPRPAGCKSLVVSVARFPWHGFQYILRVGGFAGLSI